jgi:hypothetical protein
MEGMGKSGSFAFRSLAPYPCQIRMSEPQCLREKTAALRIWPLDCINREHGQRFHPGSNKRSAPARVGTSSLEDRGNYRFHRDFYTSGRLPGSRRPERSGAARKFHCGGEADSGVGSGEPVRRSRNSG